MKCRYDRQTEERVEVQTCPVIYLIPSHFSFRFLSLSLSSILANLFHLIVYMSLQVQFSPVPSLSHSIISSILRSFLFLLPFPLTICLSHQNMILHSHPTADIPLLLRKRKLKYIKPTIFRFMCHGQKKYNHDCLERVGEAIWRDRGRNSE